EKRGPQLPGRQRRSVGRTSAPPEPPLDFAVQAEAEEGADHEDRDDHVEVEMEPDEVVDLAQDAGGRIDPRGDVLDDLHCVLHHVIALEDRKSTRLNSSHGSISYAVFCLKKKKKTKKNIII